MRLLLALTLTLSWPLPSWAAVKTVALPATGMTAPMAPQTAVPPLTPSLTTLPAAMMTQPLPVPTLPAAAVKTTEPAAKQPAASMMTRLQEPMGSWSAAAAAPDPAAASADFERRAFGGGGNGGSAGPAPDIAVPLEYARSLSHYRKAEKRRGRSVYAAAGAMVLAPLSLAGAMKLALMEAVPMTVLKPVTYGLVALCLAIVVKGAVELVRVTKARARLRAAADAVTRAAGARTKEQVKRALQDAEAVGRALLAVEEASLPVVALLAVLAKDADKLTDAERRAGQALEALLTPSLTRREGNIAAVLGASGTVAIAARRRLIWDDESLTPIQAGAEDSALAKLSVAYARKAGFADDADAELALLVARMDALYAASGPLDARRLALTLSAAGEFKWGEFGRGRTETGKSVVRLEAMLKRQGRDAQDPAARRAEAQRRLEELVAFLKNGE